MDNFFINRLKTISIAEFPFRIRQKIVNTLEEKFYPGNFKKPVAIGIPKRILEMEPGSGCINTNTTNVFGKLIDPEEINLADWQKDIFSGKSFLMSFSKKIDIRKNISLSAKCVWEVNRLQFLLSIALEYRATNNVDELDKFIRIIRSWKKGNPYLKGINWYSNIEVNLRLITWFLCWEVLNADKLSDSSDDFKYFVENDWLPLIYQHCIYSYKNPSRYSSANNHIIAEYAGLFIASSKWPFKESESWIKYSQNGLEIEIQKQHSENGINKEEAAEYIQFITDFFLLSYIVGENTNRPFSNQFQERLYSIIDYIFNFIDCKGNFPKYGDEDDGKCFITCFDESFNNFRSILTSGAIIFNNPLFKSKSNGFDIKNGLLFGESAKIKFDSIQNDDTPEKSKIYRDEGHFIFRKASGNREVYIHFDAAPLGFLSIAAHGHADALSFIVHVDGQPVLVDPGTYTYHTEPEWRNYFIGTLAHNTVRINKCNQAKMAGSTLWHKHYKCTVLRAETNDELDIVEASHNGYEGSGILHSRELRFDKNNLTITIRDSIRSKKSDPFLIELPFHLHPSVGIKNLDKDLFELMNIQDRNICIQTDEKLDSKVVSGQTNPEMIGWYSKSFLQKEPTNTLIGSFQGTGSVELETIISIK